MSRLAPRPWLMIHGARDTYINPQIAEDLFALGDGPKELWLVPDAKHNRCRDREPESYAARLLDFVDRFAPRRPIPLTIKLESLLVPADADVRVEYSGKMKAPELVGDVVPR